MRKLTGAVAPLLWLVLGIAACGDGSGPGDLAYSPSEDLAAPAPDLSAPDLAGVDLSVRDLSAVVDLSMPPDLLVGPDGSSCVTMLVFFRDADGDGYGNASTMTQACSAPVGYVADSTDCDDNVSAVHPGATETCNGVDDNCNNQIDEGVKTTYYHDVDSDGYGNLLASVQACSQPSGYVLNALDCNDAAASVHPGAAEICNGVDENCNGMIDEGVKPTYYRDADSDSYGDPATSMQACSAPVGYVNNKTDCNDASAAVHPGATEVCNGVDDNCNSQVDEGVKNTYYRDADNDSYGSATVTTQACSLPVGYVNNSTDCNDASAAVHPGATEVCNGVDDNCNSQVDEGVKNTYYRDADNDTYGNLAVTTQACSQPSGYVSNSTDCNDAAASVHPGATEVCNGVDDNCNSQVDEGVKLTFYQDADNDTYGNLAVTTQACTAPVGYVANSTDCNDVASSVHPGATEVCNGIDDNCNSQVDEGVKTTYYRDADGDAYGNPAMTTQACSTPVGYVTDGTDCDDGSSAVHPGASEVCNGIDDNCDGKIDDNDPLVIGQGTFYPDQDGDNYGAGVAQLACAQPTGYATNNTDCNDLDQNINPGLPEICDALNVDENCNGFADDADVAAQGKTTWYADADSDTYGDAATSQVQCDQPVGYVGNNTDCNDTSSLYHPGAAEVCGDPDYNCDGSTC